MKNEGVFIMLGVLIYAAILIQSCNTTNGLRGIEKAVKELKAPQPNAPTDR